MTPATHYPDQLLAALSHWTAHPFYRSALVLGIDIGLKGTGIYLRQGGTEIFAKTLIKDLPEAKPLENRRQMRAARHCRANRKRRLARLDQLLQAHGLPLPWEQNPEAEFASDAWRHRFRAIDRPQGLGSPHALAFAIRSCVSHRGYSYGEAQDEGRYPWGEIPQFNKAITWLSSAFVDPQMRDILLSFSEELRAGKESEQEKRAEAYLQQVEAAFQRSKNTDLLAVLAAHFKGDKHTNLRIPARGYAFPRGMIWKHLQEIVLKHSHMIQRPEEFLATLGLNPADYPDEKKAREVMNLAIFHYARKTPQEMAAHWEKKVNPCRLATGLLNLDLSQKELACALNSELSVRCWKLIDFSTRRVEVELPLPKEAKAAPRTAKVKQAKAKKPRDLYTLSAQAVEKLILLLRNSTEQKAAELKAAAKRILEEDVTAHSAEGARLASAAKVKDTPQWNTTYFSQLYDIIAPSYSNQKQRAGLCRASAERLYVIATEGGTDYEPQRIAERLQDAGLYDYRKQPLLTPTPMPQVEMLLGRRSKKGLLSLSHQGYLRQLFRRLRAEGVIDQDAPDYCVVEVIRDAPRNQDQLNEIIAEQDKRRQQAREEMPEVGIASRRRRIQLHAQQKGKCPYSGADLPDPLSFELEIDHLFPESMGGLTVEDNLVLTFRTLNGEKGKRTPLTWKGEQWLRSEGRRITQDMKWSALKRRVFNWGLDQRDLEQSVPPFGNVTRIAQLAKQLYAELAEWLGISSITDDKERERQRAERIGTPSGWLSTQARRSWLTGDAARIAGDYAKDRGNMVHHLIDAAIASYIPPGTGMNHVSCGGIFYNSYELVDRSIRWKTQALPQLSPVQQLAPWLREDKMYDHCPVKRMARSSKTASLGDSTFWQQPDKTEAHVAQRTALQLDKYKGDAEKLLADLRRMKIPEKQLPDLKQIRDWMVSATAATTTDAKNPAPHLCLKDGTPIKSVWKWDGKPMANLLGWTGQLGPQGQLLHLRSLFIKYDRMEIWLGWDEKAALKAQKKKAPQWQSAGWRYFKRLIPDYRALKHLKRMGLDYSRRSWIKAPAFLQDKPDQPDTHVTLRQLIQGDSLPPHSKRVGQLRRGDVFQLFFDYNGDFCAPEKAHWKDYFRVSAIKEQIALKSLIFTTREATGLAHTEKKEPHVAKPYSPEVLASLLGLPPACQHPLAAQLPTAPDDPSPHTLGRRGRHSADSGEADFRLE